MPQSFFQSLDSIRRDLAHAFRSLAKARAFTLVCVISLGIGMGALVALATFGRMITAPARLINTNGLAEILVLPQGPLRAKAGVWALEQWSYPDYRALRDSETGMAITGWVRETSAVGIKVPDEAELRHVVTLYVSSNYFSTFGVTLAKGPGFDPAIDDAASARAASRTQPRFLEEPRCHPIPTSLASPVILDSGLYTVVGVAPEDFRGHFHRFQAPSSMVFIPLERHPRLKANSECSR